MSDCPGCAGGDWATGCEICELREENARLQAEAAVKHVRVLAGKPDWTTVHPRVWDHDGDIVDLGCRDWEWSKRFFGKKRVVGVDPFVDTFSGNTPENVFRGVITATRGLANLHSDGPGTTTKIFGHHIVPSMPLGELLERFEVKRVSALKLNVEGSEYEILINLTHAEIDAIDQIAVSFHDWKGFATPEATRHVVSFLSTWYDVELIEPKWNWYLAVKRNP